MTEAETRWVVEAPADFLIAAGAAAGLNPNAVRVDGADADLVYPSFFCTSSQAWMKALAHLAIRNVIFRIYMVRMEPLEEERERSRLAVYPRIDGDLLELLREIDRREIEWLAEMSDKVEWVLEQFRQHSIELDENVVV